MIKLFFSRLAKSEEICFIAQKHHARPPHMRRRGSTTNNLTKVRHAKCLTTASASARPPTAAGEEGTTVALEVGEASMAKEPATETELALTERTVAGVTVSMPVVTPVVAEAAPVTAPAVPPDPAVVPLTTVLDLTQAALRFKLSKAMTKLSSQRETGKQVSVKCTINDLFYQSRLRMLGTAFKQTPEYVSRHISHTKLEGVLGPNWWHKEVTSQSGKPDGGFEVARQVTVRYYLPPQQDLVISACFNRVSQ